MKEMWTFNKKKSRLLAGFMAFVLVFSNIAANVQTVYATGIATPSNGTMLPSPVQNDDDTAEQAPEQETTEPAETGPEEPVTADDEYALVLDILPKAETDAETGKAVWNGGWEAYDYSELGQVLLQDSEYSALAGELSGSWSSDDTGVLAMRANGDARVKAPGYATVTFTYEAPEAEPEVIADEAAADEAAVDEAVIDEAAADEDTDEVDGAAAEEQPEAEDESDAGSDEEHVDEATPQNADKPEEISADAEEEAAPSETPEAPANEENAPELEAEEEPQEENEPAAAEDTENEYPIADGTELSWAVKVESSRVTVYSDEPYNDVMQLAVEAGDEIADFGESHLEAMQEEPPYGVNVTLPAGGAWKSLDEDVVSLTADGDMTVNVDDGACQVAYSYTVDGELYVALWDVTIGVGAELLKNNYAHINERQLGVTEYYEGWGTNQGVSVEAIGGNAVYCIQHGAALPSVEERKLNGSYEDKYGNDYAGLPAQTKNDGKGHDLTFNSLTNDQIALIAYVINAGYGSGGVNFSTWIKGECTAANYHQMLATQMLVWDVVSRERTAENFGGRAEKNALSAINTSGRWYCEGVNGHWTHDRDRNIGNHVKSAYLDLAESITNQLSMETTEQTVTLSGGEWAPVSGQFNTYTRTYTASMDLTGYVPDYAVPIKSITVNGRQVTVTVTATGATNFNFTLNKPADVSGIVIWHSDTYQDLFKSGVATLAKKANASFNITDTDVKPAPAHASLSIVKKVAINNDDTEMTLPTFTFNVTKSPANAPTPSKGLSGSIKGEGTVDFGTIEFTDQGTYIYTITESTDGRPYGFTYAGYKTATFIVSKNASTNKLEVSEPTWSDRTNVFTNTYDVTSTTWTPSVKKEITAPDGVDCSEDKFTFQLKLKDAAKSDGVIVNNVARNSGAVIGTINITGANEDSFSQITFTKEGQYTFVISETVVPKGYTKAADKEIVVNVAADSGGNLVASGTDVTDRGSNTYTFTNTYDYGTVSYQPKVSKTVSTTHYRPKAKTFTFTMTEGAENSPKVLEGGATATIKVPAGDGAATYSANFEPDTITFTKPGIYKFTIQEHNEALANKGYTYSDKIYTVTVTVTENHPDGILEKTVSVVDQGGTEVDSDEIPFINIYAPLSTTWTPAVTKTIAIEGDIDPDTGRKFKFTLSGDPENPANGAALGSETVVFVKNGEKKSFDAVTFNRAGEYKFTISETNPRIPGYSQTDSVVAADQTISVTVTDNNGQLEVTAVRGGILTDDDENILVEATCKFTNKFDYEDTYWTPSVKKTMDTNGNKLPYDYRKPFTFTMIQTGGEQVIEGPQTRTVSFAQEKEEFEKGPVFETVHFDKITFKKPGTYTFTISEVRENTDPTGYTYDTTEYNVTVVVEDVAEQDGNLQKTVTVEKKVGRFTAGGPAAADDTAYTFEFTNTYKPVPTEVVLDVKKHIDAAAEQGGYTYPEDTTFTFVLEKDLGSSGRFSMGEVLENQAVTLEANDTKPGVEAGTTEGSVSFAPLKYEKAGTYKYRIREERGDTAGFTYDSTIWLVTVEVTDNKGQLEAAVTYRNGDSTNDAAEFTNKYDTTEVSYAPQITKVIEGSETAREKEFVFSLEAVQAENGRFTMGEVIGTARLQLKAGEALGFASFDEITYNKPGTYKYLIKEVKPDDAAENYKGYTFDGTVWTLVVEVVDTGNALKVDSATYTAGTEERTDSAEFTNQYHVTETTLNAGIKKTVEGDDRPAGQEYKFLFDITQADDQEGATLPDETEITVVIRSDEGSENSGRFGDITFTAAGTYTFEIAEKDNGIPGYTYDAEPYVMTVEVVDNDSQLEVTDVSFTKSGQEVTVEPMTNEIDNTKQFETVFTNVYTVVPVEYAPKVTKEVTGEIRPEHKYFHFTLEAAEDYGDSLTMPEKTTAEVLGTANGSVTTDSFGEITFRKAGTYEFRIEETNDSLPGYTYDKNVWTLTLVVSDHASELKVDSITYATKDTVTNEDITLVGETAAAEFVNDYQVKPTVYGPEIVKTITGMPLWDETFEFELTASADNTEGGTEFSGAESARKVTVTGAGTAKFDDITFKKAGTYTFTVKETAGNSPYWTYDDRTWTLTVVVEDEDSQLVVKSHSYASNRPTPDTSETAAEFENGFTAPGELRISKTVTGNAGEVRRDFHFTVTLTDLSGNPLKGSYSYTGSSIYGSEDAPADGVITDGVVTVTLRHGQEITFHDIPAGAGYRVEEAEADTEGYRTTLTVDGNGQAAAAAEGTIQIDGTSVVEYENYRYQPTGGTTPGRPGTNIPDNEVPQSPGTPDIITISDEPTPLSNFETIEDEDVPLAFLAPMTGDNRPVGAAALFGLLALGMMGAFGILASKKDEEDA